MKVVEIEGCFDCPFSKSMPSWVEDDEDFFTNYCEAFDVVSDEDSKFKVDYETKKYVWEKCPLKDGLIFKLIIKENVKVVATCYEDES